MSNEIGPREIIVFIIVVTAAFMGVALTGYYYFCRWHNKEKSDGRRHIEAHVAEVMRDANREER